MIITNANCSCNKISSKDSSVFEEYHLSDTIAICSDSPKMSKIVEYLSYPTISNINVISNNSSNKLIFNEGYYNSEDKLMIEVDLQEKLIYTTKTTSGYVYQYGINMFKTLSISIPEYTKNKSTKELVKSGRVQINPYIENIHIRKIDDKTIYRTILLLLEVNFFI